MQIGNVGQIQQLTLKNPELMRSMSEGDKLSGEVVDVSGNTVTLKMGRRTVEALNVSGAPMQPGDKLSLMVSSKNGRYLSMQITEINSQPVSAGSVTDGEFMMIRLGLMPNETNARLMSSVLAQNVPVTDDVLDNLSAVLARFPNLSPETAAFLAVNTDGSPEAAKVFSQDLKLSGDELKAVLDFLELNAKAGDGKAGAAQAQDGLNAQAQAENPFAALKSLLSNTSALGDNEAKAVMNALSAMMEGAAAAKPDGAVNAGAERLAAQEGAIVADESSGQNQAGTADAKPAQSQNPAQTLIALLRNDDISAGAKVELLNRIISQLTGATAKTTEAGNLAGGEGVPDGPLPEEGQAARSPAEPNAPARMSLNADIKALASALSSSGGVKAGPAQLETVIKEIFARIEQSPENSGKALRDSADSLASKLQLALRLAGSSDQARVASPLSQLFTQARVTNDISNFYYAQIPYTLHDSSGTAELYVMKRKGREAGFESGSIKVALCLQTQRMGLVESILKVDSHSIDLTIRTQSRKVSSHIENSLNELYGLMEQTKYKLSSVRVTQADERITPLNAERVIENERPYAGLLNMEI